MLKNVENYQGATTFAEFLDISVIITFKKQICVGA
jgi:hypothetical protein